MRKVKSIFQYGSSRSQLKVSHDKQAGSYKAIFRGLLGCSVVITIELPYTSVRRLLFFPCVEYEYALHIRLSRRDVSRHVTSDRRVRLRGDFYSKWATTKPDDLSLFRHLSIDKIRNFLIKVHILKRPNEKKKNAWWNMNRVAVMQ